MYELLWMMFWAMVLVALFAILIYREVKKANVLAQQAITQRHAIAELLAGLVRH